jgi:hypothetical protein
LLLVWCGTSLTLALPWCLLWARIDSGLFSKAARLAAILILTIFPPLGLWGWANPLLCAGYLFPYTREAGILAAIALWIALWQLAAERRRLFRVTLMLLVAYTVFMSPISRLRPETPKDWYGARTSFGMLMSGSSNELSVYMRHQYLSEFLSKTTAKYVVMPETVAGRWDDVTEYLWAPTTVSFLMDGRTYFVGAETEKPGTEKYYNVVQVRGANNYTVKQRFPVTFAAWQPFQLTGAVANWFGEPAVFTADDIKVGVLICFEPFIYLPSLVTMLRRPNVLVVCSNHWWCRNSNLPFTSDKIAGSWSLLFDVPLVISKNI